MEGRYANTFKIGYNAVEFLIDFGQYQPDKEEEIFFFRVVTSPKYAKHLSNILKHVIDGYENKYNQIED